MFALQKNCSPNAITVTLEGSHTNLYVSRFFHEIPPGIAPINSSGLGQCCQARANGLVHIFPWVLHPVWSSTSGLLSVEYCCVHDISTFSTRQKASRIYRGMYSWRTGAWRLSFIFFWFHNVSLLAPGPPGFMGLLLEQMVCPNLYHSL